MFRLDYEADWDKFFTKMDKGEKQKVWKKIQKRKKLPKARHLKKGIPYFVVEAGQHRICFIGNHRQYEKWIKKAMRR